MVQHVSASSISLYKSCERKWYYRYVLGAKGETSVAMERGTQVHEQLERYLLDGVEPDGSTAGQIASVGLEHLPPRERVLGVEVPLSDFKLGDEVAALPFKGFIDVYARTELGLPLILDHKTTASLTYAKTEAELADNDQLVIYAWHALQEAVSANHIMISHVYYTTRKPYQSKRVNVLLSRAEVTSKFNELLKVVSAIKETADTKTLQDTVKNPAFCKAYNRTCDHYHECFFTLERRERNPMTEQQGRVLSFLRGESNTVTSTASINGATPAPSAQPLPTPIHDRAEANMARLFINVNMLKGGDARPLVEALQPLLDEVCAAHKVAHVALAPYAAGWADLAALLVKRGLPAGDWYCDAASQYYSRLSDELISAADVVFLRG